jgi:hypothetical protein
MRKVWLILALFLSSCGWVDSRFGRLDTNSTVTTFQFDHGSDFSASALELYGYIAIFLVGIDGNAYSTNMTLGSKFDSGSITLPNGNYRVYAVGWDGDNSGACTAPSPCSPVQGQARCSDPGMPSISLAGGSTTVNLTLNTANCSFTGPSVYSDGQAAEANLKPLNLKLCGSASTLPSCNTTGSTWDVSMELVVYRKNGAMFEVIESLTKQIGCAAGVGNAGVPTAKNFPAGLASAADRPFAYRFRVYPNGSGCTGTLQAEFLFGEGLAAYATAPGAGVSYFDYSNGVGSHALLLLKGLF